MLPDRLWAIPSARVLAVPAESVFPVSALRASPAIAKET
jgi:hypothetical protein